VTSPAASAETEQQQRDRLAEQLWSVADHLGSAKIAWRHELPAVDRRAIDRALASLMRLGGRVKRGEAAWPGTDLRPASMTQPADFDDEPEPPEVIKHTAAAVVDDRMAVDPDGKVKRVSEFTADERWWCDGEDCGQDLGYPHVHTYGDRPTRAVNLLTGWEIEPEPSRD